MLHADFDLKELMVSFNNQVASMPGKSLPSPPIRKVWKSSSKDDAAGSRPSGSVTHTFQDAKPQGPRLLVYTDGSTIPTNPGCGGYAALIVDGESKKVLTGSSPPPTTINAMELTPVVVALESLADPSNITVYSDSKYVVNGGRKWIYNWTRREWKTAKGKPVMNRDLWERLLDQVERHKVRFQWVKGHGENPRNNEADRLANEEAVRLFESLSAKEREQIAKVRRERYYSIRLPCSEHQAARLERAMEENP